MNLKARHNFNFLSVKIGETIFHVLSDRGSTCVSQTVQRTFP